MNQQQSVKVIRSQSYGEFEVNDSQIYHFPRGIVGLSEYQDYALVQIEDTPYHILHAIEKELSFILLPAVYAIEDYGFRIDQPTIDLLGIAKPEDVMTYLIVNIVDEQIFVNLKAPLLLSTVTQKGCQYIISDKDYPVRLPLKSEEG